MRDRHRNMEQKQSQKDSDNEVVDTEGVVGRHGSGMGVCIIGGMYQRLKNSRVVMG